MRKIDWASGDAVDLDGIERRDDVAGDAAYGHGLPGADDEVGEHHHPAGGEADGAGESGRGVGDLARGVGHGGHQPAINPADGEQQRAADGEAEKGAQGAAAEEPVVHHYEPADTDHGAPGQREVVGEAEFAGEMGHGDEFDPVSANYNACRGNGLEASAFGEIVRQRRRRPPLRLRSGQVPSRRDGGATLHGSIDNILA